MYSFTLRLFLDLARHGLWLSLTVAGTALLITAQVELMSIWLRLPLPHRSGRFPLGSLILITLALALLGEGIFMAVTTVANSAPLTVLAARTCVVSLVFAYIGAFVGGKLSPYLSARRAAVFAAVGGVLAGLIATQTLHSGQEVLARAVTLALLSISIAASQQWPFTPRPRRPRVRITEPAPLTDHDYTLRGSDYYLGNHRPGND